MRPFAFTCTLCFILWLLKGEAKESRNFSPALWISTIWFGISGSRPIGAWFNSSSLRSASEGSIHDQVVLNGLLLLSFFVLSKKHVDYGQIIHNNLSMIILFLFLLFSALFISAFPFNSFKRWYKVFGIIPIALVIYSENEPLKALESVVRRCAYILIPMSLCLIKYFPEYSVRYSYEGFRMGTGVATHKNSLGLMCAVCTFFLFWSIFQRIRIKQLFKNTKLMISDLLVLAIGVFLLFGGGSSYSATSCTIWVMSVSLLFFYTKFKSFADVLADNFVIINILFVAAFIIAQKWLVPKVAVILGRDPNLTDRDLIWNEVLNVAIQSPIFGTGYGGYWGLKEITEGISAHVDQAHNGYIDVFLQTGSIGLLFLAILLITLSDKIGKELHRCYEWGVYGMCFFPTILIYNYTEGSLLVNSFSWTYLMFIAIVFSKRSMTV